MLLWIIMTLMTAAAAVWLAMPLLRRSDDRRAASASELEVYRDQLAEVEREKAEGAIDADQAESAGLEIKRRLLSAVRDSAGDGTSLSLGERHFAVASVVGIVVLGSTILYSNSGRPDLPSVAHEATALVLGDRQQGATFKTRSGAVAAAASAPAASAVAGNTQVPAAAGDAPSGAVPAGGLGSVDDMIQRLADRLKKDPNNVETWRMLGWSYFSTERYAEAADAYRKAIDLQPKNAGMQTSYGEALVRAAVGQVRPDAIAAFDAALALEPKEPRARFFKGLVQEQAGNKQAALDTWIAVLADAGPDDAWAASLRTRITELAGELGLDVAAKLPPTPVATAPPAAAGGGLLQRLQSRLAEPEAPPAAPIPVAKGPSADTVKAAEAMTPAARQQMIRSMVDGLAARLETSPRDAEGWLQLIRSRRILGEMDAARDALAKATAAFADNPAEQARLTAAANELGVVQ